MADIAVDVQSAPTTPAAGVAVVYVDSVTKKLATKDDAGTVVAYGASISTPVTVANGGTGDTSLTAYAVLTGGTTSTGAVQSIASVGTSGQVLTSNGAGALPTFQAAAAASSGIVDEFRLSLTSGTSVTTPDVTAATTLYLTPHVGRRMTIFDSSGNATTLTSAEISIAIPATTSQMYDVWVYNSSGTLTLELLAWTNDTTRATAIVKTGAIDAAGVWTKSGDTTRRYVGSVRTTAVSGQTEDSAANRLLYNEYNYVPRTLGKYNTGNYVYTGAAWREAAGSTTHRVSFITGVSSRAIKLESMSCTLTATSSVNLGGAIGLDSTTAPTPTNQRVGFYTVGASSGFSLASSAETIPSVGFHFASQLEYGGTGTTFYDNAIITGQAAGIGGMLYQ